MNFKKLIWIAIALTGCENQDNGVTDSPANFEQLMTTEQYKSIADTDENLLSLDIHYRDDTDLKKPVVIYVHGGGWSIGDKANNLQNKINLFESLNYVFVSINYRLSPILTSQSTPDRIKYPIHNIDVADAVKWVIENIAGYGGNQEKIALLGHSAGAHLVSLTGTNQTFIEQTGYSLSNIKGVATIDTEGYNVRSKVMEGSQIYINAFGTVEQENIDASPLFNVSTNSDNPMFFIAKRGSASRIEIADIFIQELYDNNIETYQVNGSEYGHNGINNAIGSSGETTITLPLIAFFERCFE
jgi:pimeloyl-ACP methyl ester carboxylesterase